MKTWNGRPVSQGWVTIDGTRHKLRRCPRCAYVAASVWGVRQHSAYVHKVRLDKHLQERDAMPIESAFRGTYITKKGSALDARKDEILTRIRAGEELGLLAKSLGVAKSTLYRNPHLHDAIIALRSQAVPPRRLYTPQSKSPPTPTSVGDAQPREVHLDPLGRVKCPICGTVCPQLSHLRDHFYRQHHDMWVTKTRGGPILYGSRLHTKFICPTCHKGYGGLNSLHLHERKAHGTVIPTARARPSRALIPQAAIRDPLEDDLRARNGLPPKRRAFPKAGVSIAANGAGVSITRWEGGLYLVRIPKFGIVLGPRVRVTVEPIEEGDGS